MALRGMVVAGVGGTQAGPSVCGLIEGPIASVQALGFSEEELGALATGEPEILTAPLDCRVKPAVALLASRGVTGSALRRLLLCCPAALTQEKLRPALDYLSGELGGTVQVRAREFFFFGGGGFVSGSAGPAVRMDEDTARARG
jgi:mTERF